MYFHNWQTSCEIKVTLFAIKYVFRAPNSPVNNVVSYSATVRHQDQHGRHLERVKYQKKGGNYSKSGDIYTCSYNLQAPCIFTVF